MQETAYQFGRTADGVGLDNQRNLAINAWASGTWLGHTWYNHEWKPRLAIGFDYASGDGDSNCVPPGGTLARSCGDNANTFENFFPTNFLHVGYMLNGAWRNSVQPQINVQERPTAPDHVEIDPDPNDCKFFQQVATQIAYAIDHVLAYQQIKQLSEQLRRENEYLADEVKASRNLRLVVGTSPAFTKLVDLVRAVAPTDTTVLLLGETGTGKEVLAQALHDLSARSSKPFIRVNCAALPPGLIESELFGHERGAFTGAQLRRAGRFELAHSGTLFLDEIGEMPLETQAKLLRVLQDGRVDRIGGTQPISVDVRLIAVTNADLSAAIQRGTFRADLYYRLHIFPIALPALRDRQEDIRLLAQHFLAQIGAKLKRTRLTFDPHSMTRLLSYHWPGNIRELHNVIERAVILSGSSRVTVDERLFPSIQVAATPSKDSSENLSEVERNHILERTKWRIYGDQGAAQVLGLNPETLRSVFRSLEFGALPADPPGPSTLLSSYGNVTGGAGYLLQSD